MGGMLSSAIESGYDDGADYREDDHILDMEDGTMTPDLTNEIVMDELVRGIHESIKKSYGRVTRLHLYYKMFNYVEEQPDYTEIQQGRQGKIKRVAWIMYADHPYVHLIFSRLYTLPADAKPKFSSVSGLPVAVVYDKYITQCVDDIWEAFIDKDLEHENDNNQGNFEDMEFKSQDPVEVPVQYNQPIDLTGIPGTTTPRSEKDKDQ
jgi:hypothetical protein